jgi:hypothetical protein
MKARGKHKSIKGEGKRYDELEKNWATVHAKVNSWIPKHPLRLKTQGCDWHWKLIKSKIIPLTGRDGT